MQATTNTYQELLARMLGVSAPQTTTEEIELACLALMGDRNIRPIDNPDVYCAKLLLAKEEAAIFIGGSATPEEKILATLAFLILDQHQEIPRPVCAPS